MLLLIGITILQSTAARAADRDSLVIQMLPGVVEAWQTVDLALSTTGAIAEITVREMQPVEKGQLLALLDDRLARASLEVAEAVANRSALLLRAESTVALAEKYLERVRDAHSKNAASGLELDEAKGRVEEARAGLAQAHEQKREADAQVALAQVRLSSHELRAPFAGIVMRIAGKPGGTANPKEPIMRLTNASQLRVSLCLPVNYFGRLKVAQTYTLAADAPAPSRVEAICLAHEPVIDAATDTFRCVFEIENSDLSLPAGFAVRLCEPKTSVSSGR